MKNILSNWKTTSLGISMIVAAIVMIAHDATKVNESTALVLGGIGFILTADGKTPATPAS